MALPLLLGQNIGSCVTALISSVGANKPAKRVAFVHLYFNVIGTVVFLSIFYLLNAFISMPFMEESLNAVGIAVIHTGFNVLATALFLPFTKQLEKLACLTVRDDSNDEKLTPMLLDERLLKTPSVAIEQCRNVCIRMARLTQETLKMSMEVVTTYDAKKCAEVIDNENAIDIFEDKIGSYILKISSKDLSENDSKIVSSMLHTIGDLERISDHAVNIVEAAEEMHSKKIKFSQQALRELPVIVNAVSEILDMSINAFVNNDVNLAKNVEPLEDVIDQLISTGSATHSKTGGTLKTGVTTLPDFDKDATDRNRTSPFAFTGNKFEFRMVGSSDSVSSANVVLNTIVAEAFKEAADELEKADDFDLAVHDMIKKLLADHRRIIFNGNGYSEAWVEEAERRGLPNLKCMVDAIPSLVTDKAFKLFGDFGVYTKEELVARAEIEYESYAKSVNIEAKAMINIAGKQLIPAVVRYTTVLAQSLSAVKTACPEADNSVQTELLIEVSDLLSDMKVARAKLEDLVEEYQHIDSMEKRAHFCYDEIIPAMQALRSPADQLEMIVDKEYWPIPSYGDMIFEV